MHIAPSPTATVDLQDELATVTVHDPRTDILSTFGSLTESQRNQLSVDAWVIGLRAVANARAQAQEARLADIGRTLLQDISEQLDIHVRTQEQAVTSVLQKWFDPSDGQVSARLRSFVDDQGSLARMLERFVGSRNSGKRCANPTSIGAGRRARLCGCAGPSVGQRCSRPLLRGFGAWGGTPHGLALQR